MKIGDREFEIKKPNHKNLTEAQLYSSKVFSEAVRAGVTLRQNLEDELRKRGSFSEDKVKRLLDVSAELNTICKDLSKGKKGKYKKLSEARLAAIQARQLRAEQTELLMENRRLDTYTAEGLAEQARFDYLVSVCVYENGQKVFSNVDDYLEKATEPWIKQCAEEFSYVLYNVDRTEEVLPEDQFLKKHNLINDKGELIDQDGNLVDISLNQINIPEIEEYEDLENDLWQNKNS